MASLPVIVQYLALFHEAYPTRGLTEHTAEAWEVMLADVTDNAFRWGADRILREPGRTYFPTPNEIRAHLARHTPPLALPNPDDPVTKWYAEKARTSKRIPSPEEPR